MLIITRAINFAVKLASANVFRIPEVSHVFFCFTLVTMEWKEVTVSGGPLPCWDYVTISNLADKVRVFAVMFHFWTEISDSQYREFHKNITH